MTEPSTVHKPKLQSTQRSFNWGIGLLIIIFRLLLLSVGGATAGLLGIAIAQVVPGNVDDPPFLENVLRGGASLRQNVRQLPEWGEPDSDDPQSSPQADDSSTASDPTSEDTDSATESPSGFTSDQQQRLQSEIDQLQVQLTTVRDRTSEIEALIGLQPSKSSLEERLQTLEQQLTSAQTKPSSDPASPVPAIDSSISRDGDILITLPSDALFGSDPTVLSADSRAVLDPIIDEIQNYPGAAVQVAGFSASQNSPEGDRRRAFEQATVIKHYLADALGEQQHHWVVVGYGRLHRSEESVSPDESLDRRIEISITP
ncbi:MAG: OmpA family protein [Elainellaceae cyanobacterium]